LGKIKKSAARGTSGDYQVGYGKPPAETRFKPGQSGNPRGRAKHVRNFKSDVTATLRAPVRVTRDGAAHRISTQEAALFRLREKALSGDNRALDRLLQLAQLYNAEEVVASSALAPNDTALVEIFASRVLSGAVRPLDSASPPDTQPSHEDSSTPTLQEEPRPQKLPRYRPKRIGSRGAE